MVVFVKNLERRQLSFRDRQLSVVSCQLSVVSCQLSVVSCQLSVERAQARIASRIESLRGFGFIVAPHEQLTTDD